MSAKELNIGDYVRTKKGTFDRFITSHTQDNLTWYTFEDRGNITNPENYIIKSSPNIIELLEVGDLIKLKFLKHYQEVEYIDEKELCLTECIYYNVQKLDNFIEWVITHKQLNEIKYEVSK